jgi:hypothetical protein
MTAIDNTPINKNFLSPLNFKFQIKRAPHINFFIQRVNIPSIRLPQISIPTEFLAIPTTGTKPEYGEFSIQFKVDEDFENYLEIHNWLRALGFPDNYGEYKQIASQPEYTGNGLRSDLSLIVLNAIKNPNFEIVLRDAFPTYISELNFDTTQQDVEYMTATATFSYILFNIQKIS